jgi:hypothetical protein
VYFVVEVMLCVRFRCAASLSQTLNPLQVERLNGEFCRSTVASMVMIPRNNHDRNQRFHRTLLREYLLGRSARERDYDVHHEPEGKHDVM